MVYANHHTDSDDKAPVVEDTVLVHICCGQAREHLIDQSIFAHGSLAKEESKIRYWSPRTNAVMEEYRNPNVPQAF